MPMNFNGQSPLSFSQAYQVAGYETVNDKILREMNARAEQAMKQPASANVLDNNNLGAPPPLSPTRPRAIPRPRSPQNRYSAAHRREFQRSASIAPPIMRPPQSMKKQSSSLESPSKRLRTAESAVPLYQTQPMSNTVTAGAALASRQRQRSPVKSPSRQNRIIPHKLPPAPKELPSYMRPTQASLLRSPSATLSPTRPSQPSQPSQHLKPISSGIPRSTSMRSVSSPLPARSSLRKSQ